MGATTTEGTGVGSVTAVKPPILNGVVKAVNIDIDNLKSYEHDIVTDGFVEVGTDLTVNGTTELNDGLEVTGNIAASGHIRGGASGQLVNTYVSSVVSGNLTSSGSTLLTLVTVNYTPVSTANVNLLIEYHADYIVAGGGTDSFQSTINVDGSPIAYRTQSWSSSSGASTRGGILFPIAAVHNVTGQSSLAITVKVQKTAGDDTTTVYQNGSDPAVIRISEYIA